jgi:serine/threonine-protein kinase
LTGSLVFEAETLMALAAKHVHEDPVPPSLRAEMEIPPDLEGVILDCLRKNPAERPASAGELADRLHACDVATWTGQDSKSWWQLRFPDGSIV